MSSSDNSAFEQTNCASGSLCWGHGKLGPVIGFTIPGGVAAENKTCAGKAGGTACFEGAALMTEDGETAGVVTAEEAACCEASILVTEGDESLRAGIVEGTACFAGAVLMIEDGETAGVVTAEEAACCEAAILLTEGDEALRAGIVVGAACRVGALLTVKAGEVAEVVTARGEAISEPV
jgi:hypothetical protein